MKRDDEPGPLPRDALLRHHVVSLVRARLLAGVCLAAAVDEIAGMGLPTEAGELRRVSRRSIYRWVAQYERGGPAALVDQPRATTSTSKVLDPELLQFLAAERTNDQDASIPELLRRAARRGVLAAPDAVNRTTVYRAFVRMQLPTARRKKQRGRDMRRFAYPHRMQMVLADGAHFRAGAQRLRRVACFFLDDATRRGLHVAVGTSESAALFLPGLHRVLRDHGRMDILYLDRGPAFIASALAEVCRRLEIALLHGESRYPEGHGKIERFNQTAKRDVLRAFDGRPDVDPACGALELRIGHWLREVYNRTGHEGLPR